MDVSQLRCPLAYPGSESDDFPLPPCFSVSATQLDGQLTANNIEAISGTFVIISHSLIYMAYSRMKWLYCIVLVVLLYVVISKHVRNVHI